MSDPLATTGIISEFARRFGGAPTHLGRAPGRVNLIGDHTDYNEGFVLPIAIDRAVRLAARPRRDRQVRIYSLDFREERAFSLDERTPRDDGWIEYVRGVAYVLAEEGKHLIGWEGVMAGDVPVGAGLSSSAALEVAATQVFATLSNTSLGELQRARIAQRAENEWIGVQCGIMDQLISVIGRAGHAVLIDCRSLTARFVPIGSEAGIVVLDTGTRRGLVDSAYNERRAQCEQAARYFGVPALRDVDLATFEDRAGGLDAITRKRARHVITENARTIEAASLLEGGDHASVGLLMLASHASLRDDFEVSRPELDTMVELARRHAACYGARMTGAGFGGCAVALVQASQAASFEVEIAAEYERAVGIRPAVYRCTPSSGAAVEVTA